MAIRLKEGISVLGLDALGLQAELAMEIHVASRHNAPDYPPGFGCDGATAPSLQRRPPLTAVAGGFQTRPHETPVQPAVPWTRARRVGTLAVEPVNVRSASSHAHHQREGRSGDQWSGARGKRSIVCAQL